MALDTQVPQWLVNQNMWEQQDASHSVDNLVSSWFEGQKLGIQKQQASLALANGMLGMQQKRQELALGATKLNNQAVDNQTIPSWLQAHPTWQSRQDAEWPVALSDPGNDMLNQVRLRDAHSVQAKAATTAISDFSKRVNTLSATDPAAAGQFAQYIGVANPSPTILSALSVAEQAAALRKQNAIDQAATTAQASGAVPTVTVGPRGVTTTYKQPPASQVSANATPNTMTLDNGTTVAWMPGGKTLHVIQPSGKKDVYTPFQLQSIAKGLDSSDVRQKQITDFLANGAVKQITPKTNSAFSPSSPTTDKDPLGLGIK